MTDEIRQNLEYASSVCADKMDSRLEAEELKKLAEGTAAASKAYAEIEDMEIKRKLEEEKNLKEQKREKIFSILDHVAKFVGLAIDVVGLAAMISLGKSQKSDETDAYVKTPKTNSLVLDNLKRRHK